MAKKGKTPRTPAVVITEGQQVELQEPSGEWVRATVAVILAQTVDTLIFVTIAFYGKFALLPVIGGQLAAKALVWGLAIPLLYLAVAVGRRLDRG